MKAFNTIYLCVYVVQPLRQLTLKLQFVGSIPTEANNTFWLKGREVKSK